MTWAKKIIKWRVGGCLYFSVPFTWLLPEARIIAKQFKGKVIAGGPAISLMGCDWAETPISVPYDILSFHNPLATFTTRGCTNTCKYCAVPKIEGEFRELKEWKPNPIVCDNNILASSKKHFKKVIDILKVFPYVDFNQGLDARLLTDWHVDQLSRLRKVKIRFAFDSINYEGIVKDAVDSIKKKGLKDIGVYVLIGFNDTPEEARYKLEQVSSWDVLPNPSRYQPLDALEKNSYVHPNWTERELKKVTRYYYRLNWVGHVPYDDFISTKEDMMSKQCTFGLV